MSLRRAPTSGACSAATTRCASCGCSTSSTGERPPRARGALFLHNDNGITGGGRAVECSRRQAVYPHERHAQALATPSAPPTTGNRVTPILRMLLMTLRTAFGAAAIYAAAASAVGIGDTAPAFVLPT